MLSLSLSKSTIKIISSHLRRKYEGMADNSETAVFSVTPCWGSTTRIKLNQLENSQIKHRTFKFSLLNKDIFCGFVTQAII